MTDRDETAKSYDAVADEYVAHIYGELRDKPLDRQLLDRFADAVRTMGPVCDVGCGPGHVARYLHVRGVDVSGIDLSAGMVERARRLNPGIGYLRQAGFEVEDVRERDPYPDVEHPSRRSYVVARKPAGAGDGR